MISPIVIKVGGAILESPDFAAAFFKGVAQVKDFQPIIVHGGGAQVQDLLAKLGFKSEKQHGVRVTPVEHMPYITGVLAGSANKQLVAYAQSEQCNAVGVSAVDGGLIKSQISKPELGCVGIPTGGNPSLLIDMLNGKWLPIVSSIGADETGQLVNINADHAASAIAESLSCPLVLLSDVAAVLDEKKQRIAAITDLTLPELIRKDVIIDGMRVKVETAMTTARKTQQHVTIASWKDNIQQIINANVGTQVLTTTDRKE